MSNFANMSNFDNMSNFENMSNFANDTNNTATDNITGSDCLQFSREDYRQIEACGYWVEGVAMAVLGIFALITNAISIYVFSRYS